MANHKFLSVTFNFEGRVAPREAINKCLDHATDWANYASNCYIVYTGLSPEEWYNRLKKVVHADDSIFLVEINLVNRFGYLPKSTWEWIDKKR